MGRDQRRWQWAVKRLLEWPTALVLAIATLPLQLLIALAIKLDSPGPALFIQPRRGRDGRCFRMYKFRTLRWAPDIEPVLNPDGSTRVTEEDARLTRVGRLLRLGWDELPQLWNVVKGEMALIGPRPDEPFHLQYYTEEQKRRLDVLPGITGLPQVTGRNAVPWKERIALDLYYIEHHSSWLDFKIALGTARTLLGFGKHRVAETEELQTR